MTELEQRRDTVEMAPLQPTALMLWAMDAAEAYKVAVSLCKTSFVPSTLRGKPEEAAAAILTGAEMGLSPMAALRSIDIISGTPAMRANALRGLVQSQGHEVWVEDASSSRAVVCGRRKGSQVVQRSEWDLERAKGLNLLKKDNWLKQPQAMLIARATSELCRLVASDVLLGLAYSQEELEDSEDSTPPARTSTVARKPVVRAKAPEMHAPALDNLEPTVPVASEPETPEPVIDWPEVAKAGNAE